MDDIIFSTVEIGNRLDHYFKKRNIIPAEISKKCNLERSQVYKIFSGQWKDIMVSTIFKLKKGYGDLDVNWVLFGIPTATYQNMVMEPNSQYGNSHLAILEENRLLLVENRELRKELATCKELNRSKN